ncbi:MAG: dTDP-glucose 4,6-dehydratase [Patescibacteria group bacterium]|nr:dTDP-glucose 4,6-dehydratase [Patescibacteria group bacterium]MDD5121273.1 dTDP-glucose 4,6-dehydratase [Patescibacteria group bacterium]MDD5221834.1 dTDP-glucose 4,6-dehydratase [Patescibacteria group bacterium]MDD5395808.1 dTDP-glucose 4,6-dehydratase [Patescibacteria group bacterium]
MTKKIKTILITGGCGFIGSNFIRYFLAKHSNYRIINLDKLTYAGRKENLKDLAGHPRYKFIKGDVCDKKIVELLVKKSEEIIHFAAESHVDRSIEGPETFLRTNIFGTYVLLEAARKYKIKKFLFISTDEVYGSIKSGKFCETSNLAPNSPYSVSKTSADLLCRAYFKTYGLPILITRSSNNFGPYQFPEKVIPLFITNLMRNKKVPLYGTGKNVRDWIYVLDNCTGIDFVRQHGKFGEIYNIGGGNELPNVVLTKSILKALKKDNSWIQPVADRLGHDWRYALDCTKIKKLGWQPKYNFEKAIDETIKWYVNNPWWWKPLIK